jgi:phage terminase small subunit
MAKNKETGLSDIQESFCREYVVDKNGTRSAIQAGYSKKTADVKASQLLRLVKIRARIDALQAKINEKNEISADYVVKKFKDLAERALLKGDMVNENRALENLGKYTGIFERDNKQKTDGLLSGIIDVIRKGSD